MNDRSRPPIGARNRAVALIFVALGLCLLAASVPGWLRWREAPGWPGVAAEVRTADVGVLHGRGGAIRRTRVTLGYRYLVDGQAHDGEFTREFGAGPAAQAASRDVDDFVRAHRVGSTLVVFVDPRVPWRAAVDRDEFAADAIVLSRLGALALAGGLVIGAMALVRGRR